MWVSYKILTPIAVKRGDLLGVFYDNHETMPHNLLTIFAERKQITDENGKYLTRIFNYDSSDLVNGQVINDFIKSEYLEPALTAVVTSVSYTRRLRPPESIPPITPAFQLQNFATANVNNCSLVAIERERKFGTSEDFGIYSGNLHIFNELSVKCPGRLTKWHFLAPANDFIYGLTLAVFRTRDQIHFSIVGKTEIKKLRIPLERRNTWVTLPLNPNDVIEVAPGDILGFFYGNKNIPRSFLSIGSSSYYGLRFLTLVFDVSGYEITGDRVNANQQNMTLDYQQPALAATIEVGHVDSSRSEQTVNRPIWNQSTLPQSTMPPSSTPMNFLPGNMSVWLNLNDGSRASCQLIRQTTAVVSFKRFFF